MYRINYILKTKNFDIGSILLINSNITNTGMTIKFPKGFEDVMHYDFTRKA